MFNTGLITPCFLILRRSGIHAAETIIPWMFKYVFTAPKNIKIEYTGFRFSKTDIPQNQSLLDIIAQHFFQETPAFFALSLPEIVSGLLLSAGGTGVIISKLV